MEKFTDDEGAQMLEYGLLITLIAIVVMVAVVALGLAVPGLYDVPWFD